MDSGLLVLRAVFGLAMAAHGAQKLFGWFGGYGLTGTGGFLEQLGFRPGRVFAALAGGTELLGGLLLAAGFLTPFGSAAVIAVMIVAAGSVHWQHGFFATANGIELPVLYAAAAAALALAGPGVYSFDAALGLASWWTPQTTLALIGFGVVGGFLNLMVRRTAPQPLNA